MPRFRGQRFSMNNFEINEARPAGLLVVDNVIRAGVDMRPRSAELIAPKPMRSAQFVTRRFHHFSRDRAVIQMLP